MSIHILFIALISLFCLAGLLPFSHSSQPPFSCDTTNPKSKSYLFCQTTLPINQRAQDLVSRLTIDEKILQLVNTAPGIPRLGIPAYEWWSEALHGVSDGGFGMHFGNGSIRSATSFPQVILTAASFDHHLWYRIGQVIGKEARAVYNEGQAGGMTFWAPNINIFRDPRWGRGQETPGEDPLVTGRYAVSYVRGLQGYSFNGKRNGEFLQASACCKHFTAYDLDKWKTVDRFGFNAIVTKQDLADTYQPPFKSCIEEGKASGIMCAYNRVNGVPNCADYNLLTRTARQQWKFDGYIVSDCDAVSIIRDNHHYVKEPEEAVADVLKAGMDVNCGSYLKNHTKSALDQKRISEHDIDRALHNLFSIRMRLGLFNGNPTKLLFGNIGPDQVCSKEHQELALEAARRGIVLLKNDAKHLPLSKKTTSLAVIGPNADASNVQLGNYQGPPCKHVSVLNALKNYVQNGVSFLKGCDAVNCTKAAISDAVKVAQEADHVILVMGLDQTQETEYHDREILTLPGEQESLVTSVSKAAKNPVILVLLCGGPVDISFAKDDPKIGSILWAGYPGESGGIALAEIIFGDHNPGGRLPMTWYPKEFVNIPMTDMRMRADPSSGYPGRTYRFYKGKKVFEFGYGLSYSTYSYNISSVTQKTIHLNNYSTVQPKESADGTRYLPVSSISTESCDNAKFSVIVGVENAGEMVGKHPVLLFVKTENAGNGNPVKQLVGFQVVHLDGGAKGEAEFSVSPCEHFSSASKDGLMVLQEGTHYLVVGDNEYPIDIVTSM